MHIEKQNLDEFVRIRLSYALASQTGARRLVADDFERFWDFYETYEQAMAEGGDVRSPHHAMGSILQQLSNWQLYDLDSALRRDLERTSGHGGPWPIAVVREALGPLRTLASAVISEVEERLGPVPPLDSVPLLDLDWLGVVAVTGQVPADPEPPGKLSRPSDFALKLAASPVVIVQDSERAGSDPPGTRRTTMSDVAVALASLSAAPECRAAIEQSDFATAESLRQRISISARGCRAVRVVVAAYDINRSLAIGDRAEALAKQADLELACTETDRAASAFLRLVRSRRGDLT